MKTPLEAAAKIETEVRCIMKSFIANNPTGQYGYMAVADYIEQQLKKGDV